MGAGCALTPDGLRADRACDRVTLGVAEDPLVIRRESKTQDDRRDVDDPFHHSTLCPAANILTSCTFDSSRSPRVLHDMESLVEKVGCFVRRVASGT